MQVSVPLPVAPTLDRVPVHTTVRGFVNAHATRSVENDDDPTTPTTTDTNTDVDPTDVDDPHPPLEYLRPSAAELRLSSILKLPTMRLRGPVFHGWLWKKGASFKTWKQRFFLLNGCTLTYYTHGCVIETEVGTRCLEMPATGGLRVASAVLSDATSLGICITSTSGRVLDVQAGDRTSRTKWLGVLQEAPKRKCREATIRGTSVSECGSIPLSFAHSPSTDPTVGVDTASATSIPSSSASSTLSSDLGGDNEDEEDEDGHTLDMRGWLHVRRRGALLKSYKKRYVALVDGHITLSHHARAPPPRDMAHEVISATAWKGHTLGLRIQLGGHKELLVHTSSTHELEQWRTALQNNL